MTRLFSFKSLLVRGRQELSRVLFARLAVVGREAGRRRGVRRAADGVGYSWGRTRREGVRAAPGVVRPRPLPRDEIGFPFVSRASPVPARAGPGRASGERSRAACRRL